MAGDFFTVARFAAVFAIVFFTEDFFLAVDLFAVRLAISIGR
jgi:hypothetical protein